MIYMIKEDIKNVVDSYIFVEYSNICKEFFEKNYTINNIDRKGKYYFYNIMSKYDSITGVNDNNLSDYDIILMS